jgi:hypothetical protein
MQIVTDVGNRMKDNSSDHISRTFPVVWLSKVQVLWSWDHHLRNWLWALLLDVRRSLPVNVDFRSLFLFGDVVFLWFVYAAGIILDAAALDTPNNTAVFVTDAPAKREPTDKFPTFWFIHTHCHWVQSPVHLHEHYRV